MIFKNHPSLISHMAANFSIQIFEIKISSTFANDERFLCLSNA